MWMDGECHGHGSMVYSNGDTYEGNWKWGERDGKDDLTLLKLQQLSAPHYIYNSVLTQY